MTIKTRLNKGLRDLATGCVSLTSNKFSSHFYVAIRDGHITEDALAEKIGCSPTHLSKKINSLKAKQVQKLALFVVESQP